LANPTPQVPSKVTQVSCCSTSQSFTELAKEGKTEGFWFRTFATNRSQAAMAAHLIKEKGYENVAVIYVNTEHAALFTKMSIFPKVSIPRPLGSRQADATPTATAVIRSTKIVSPLDDQLLPDLAGCSYFEDNRKPIKTKFRVVKRPKADRR